MKRGNGSAKPLNVVLTLLTLFVLTHTTSARFTEPQPGEIYRDYYKILDPGSLKDWRVTDPNAPNSGARAYLPNSILSLNIADLQGAVRAEAIIDQWGGHPGTTTKRMRFNNNAWIPIQELATTPTSGECYNQQYNLTIDVPLAHLIQGNNLIEGTSGGQTCFDFGWGQWGWYGILVRVYFSPSKTHATGQITSHTTGGTFGDNPTIAASVQSSTGISRVEFLAHYEGYDVDGDGIYRDWQRHYHRGWDAEVRAKGIVGTATASPWQVVWNTDWVPNQPTRGVKLVARIRNNSGIWFVTNIVDSLTFLRTNGSVKLYKPIDVSESFWVRDNNTKSCTIPIPSTDTLTFATAAKLHLATWNCVDCQGNGTHWKRINGWNAPIVGENHYYAYNEITVPTTALVSGNNIFSFFSGSIHHGVEIMWPGPAISVRYSRVTSASESVVPSEFTLGQNYPNPFNPATTINYSLPEQSAVTLRVLDLLGREVTTLTDANQQAGYFTARWNGTNTSGQQMSSGVYIYRLDAKNSAGKAYSLTKRLLLIK
ncbi:MAG: T9SS type A sorting domain-containing protein [Ignavibacteriae bacterium]|nr:T9SS type A sorting domain-containing protein [Ignavibacteriota bacterium]